MPRLVAVDLPGGPDFVAALLRVWDRGDAVAPIDRRLPPPARAAALAELAPSAIVGPDLVERPLEGGVAVDDGDALVVATSGSTGSPKGVVLTHDSLRAHARAVHARLAVEPGRDRWLACLPLAPLLVGSADHDHLGDRGQLAQDRLDRRWPDVLAAGDDHVATPAVHD